MMRRFILQERTSEESKESESFKGLLHARTQEFIDEVYTCTYVQIATIQTKTLMTLILSSPYIQKMPFLSKLAATYTYA